MLAFAEGTFGADGGHPVNWVATGRFGGVSAAPYDWLNLADHVGDDPTAVAINRDRVREHLGAAGLAVMQAEHGGTVSVVTEPGTYPATDALATRVPGLALLALAADCVPIALADPTAGVIAAVHCGWKGLAAGIVANAVQAMRQLGAADIHAVLGPSICAHCYPVPVERVDALRLAVPEEVARAACTVSGDQAAIDVAAGVLVQLSAADVAVESIARCTAESAGLFSYRRDGVTGRQGIAVVTG